MSGFDDELHMSSSTEGLPVYSAEKEKSIHRSELKKGRQDPDEKIS